MIKHNWGLAVLLVILSACAGKKNSSDDVPTTRYDAYTGNLNIACDAGLQSIIKQQQEVFEYAYDSIQVNIKYEEENEMFADFKRNEAGLMILARPLIPAEIDDFKTNDTIYIKQLPVAYDAVAIIGSKDFNDKELSVELLKTYFSPQSSLVSLPRLVFDNQHSSLVRFVLDFLGYKKEAISSNVFAMKSGSEVIEYVAQNQNAIGFVPFNLISDTDDDRIKQVLKRIKILSLRAKKEDGEIIHVSANQSDIKTGDYPLVRTVTAITRFTHQDNVESLFMSFLSKERGAKIFLKAGLIPVKMTEREIIVNEGEVRGSK